MSILNSSTSYLIEKVGQTYRQIQEIVYSSIKQGVDFKHNTPRQSTTLFNILSVKKQSHYTTPPELQTTSTMLKQIEPTKNNPAKAISYYLVQIGQLINRPLVRIASITTVASVIFSASMVVLLISDVHAQTINYSSTVAGNVSQNVTEPTGNAGSTEVSYVFFGVDTPRSGLESVALTIEVLNTSTAREGVDFTIPENQTVNASISSPDNKIRVMLNGDTFKEGNETIVLKVTLPDDDDTGLGAEFKQYAGGTVGGPETKSITITFNITDEASDTEIDPIKPVSVVNYQQGELHYLQRGGNDGVTEIVTVTEPADDSATTDAHFNFRTVNSNQANPENTSIPVSVSVVEGPTTAREGTDFVIPPNQTLDLSSAGIVNQITIQVKGDSFDEPEGSSAERVIVIVTIPDDIPVHFKRSIAGGTMRKSLRIRYDISDNSDDNGKGSEPNNRTITLASSSTNGALGGDIHYSVSISPAPTSPISVPIYARDGGSTDENPNTNLTLPGTFDSNVPAPEPRIVQFITVGSSGTAAGVIRVANSGVTSPVTLTMHPSIKSYSFVPSGRSISVPLVTTPAATEISISGPTSAVDEGNNAAFTLTADNTTRSSDMTISVNAQDIANRTGADYVTEGTYYAVLKANMQTTTLNIPTIDDEVEGVDGVVMATITSAGGYTVNSSSNEAFAIVRDTDGITPSTVTVSATQTSIEEGNMATFTISRGTANFGSMDVGYILADTRDVIDGEGTELIATILDGQAEVNVSVHFNTSMTDYGTNDGVELTIRSLQQFAGARYRVGSAASVKITVTNAALPQISLSEVPSSVTQGHDFTFKVSASETLTSSGLPITIQFGEGLATIITDISPGTYEDGSDSTLTIPQSGSQVVTVSTTNDPNAQNQDLTITLAGAGSTYTIAGGAGGTKTVLSKDNKTPTAALPRISIEPFPTKPYPASRNDTLTFKLISTPIPNAGKSVMVQVDSTGDSFFNGSYGLETQILDTDRDTDFVIQISDGGSPNQSGTISVRLVDGDGYTIADSPNHKTSANINDKTPEVKITELTGSVTQGHPYSFKLESSAILTEPLNVKILLNNASGSITGAIPSSVFNSDGSEGTVTVPISGSQVVMVNTQNPTDSSGNQTENIVITSDTSFPVTYKAEDGGASRNYPVEYKDNTASTAAQPRLSIADITDSVQADTSEMARFTITATPTPSGTINVYYSTRELGDFVADDDFNEVLTFSGDTATLSVATTDPAGNQADSELTVTLLDRAEYSLANPNGHIATATITDDAPMAIGEVTVVANEFRAGNSGSNYIFIRNIAPNSPLVVNYKTIATGGAETTGTAIIPAEKYTVQVVIPDSQTHTRIEIVPHGSYTVGSPSTADKLASVTSTTASSPGVSIFIIEDAVPEGGIFNVVGVVTPAFSTGTLSRAKLSATDPTNKITDFNEDFPIRNGDTEALKSFTIINDDVPGADGTVTISWDGGAAFTAPTVNVSDTITVTEDDGSATVAELKLESAYTAGVLAGDLILFDVTMTPPPESATQIAIEAIDGTRMQLTGSPITVTINPAAGQASSTTRGQIAVAATGVQVSVTLQFASSVTGYTFVPIGRSIDVPLRVQSTTPNLTIAGKGAVDEGDDAVFTITADQQSNVPVTVEINGTDLSARTGVNYVTAATIYQTLPANMSSVEISIPTIENNSDEKDGVVEATLVDRVGYNIPSGATPGYVDVHDDDGAVPTLVSVTATPTSVVAGTDATFTFNRTGATTDALPFGYELIETGEVTTETPGNVTTVQFDAGKSTDVITISTAGSTINSGDGITLRVLPPSEFNEAMYRVDANAASVKVNVTPFIPELTLSVENEQTFLDGEIEFTVSIAPPPAIAVTIPVVAVDANNSAQTVTPTGGVVVNPAVGETSSSATGRVSVAGTGTGPITIKLADSVTDYIFVPSGKSVDVPIVDPPSDVQVYVEAPETVNEGSSVSVTVQIPQPPSGSTTSSVDLTIGLSVADFAGRNAEYIDETTLYEVLKSGQTSVSFSVPTKAPTTGLLDGVLVATIVDDVGYTPITGRETGYIEVFDLNFPADILTVTGDASSIIEGEDAVFTITRTGSNAEVSFQYNISVSDANIYSGNLLDIASTIPANRNERKITITTTEPINPLADNTNIQLTLENTREFVTADYRINQSSATINVTDKIPVVAFKNYPTNITIGHSFTFTVEADPNPANPLSVGLNFAGISPSSLFASREDSAGNAVTNSVMIPTSGSVEITVTTAAAGTSGDQSNQSISFSAPASGAGYSVSTVATESRATINLLDNSNPTELRPNVALQTHTTETVSLATASELTFNIIASHVPTNNVDVNVLVSETDGNFLSSSTVSPVRLAKTAGQTITPFTVAIADDDINTLSGESTITVTLTHGDGYTLVDSTANPNHTTNAKVIDVANPLPMLSIANAPETLAGYNATFVVTSSIQFVGSLNVTYRPVKSGGDYLNETDGTSGGPNTNSEVDRTIPLSFAKVGDDYTATLSFATVDDVNDPDGGTITVTLQNDSADPVTYRVSTTAGANTAMVSVIKVPIPELTITSASTKIEVDEGRTAEIIVQASENPKRELTFNFTPTETDTNYLTPLTQDDVNKGSGVERSISLEFKQADSSPGSTDPWLATISLETQGHDATGGTITVVLGSGTGYTVGTSNTATITVTKVGDLVPSVSIVLLNESATISEGQTIRTVLRTESAHPTATNPIRVSISVNQVGGDYIAYRVPRVVEMTSNTEPLNISTLDDSVQDGAGSIRVTIAGAGDDFTIDNSYIEVEVSEDSDSGEEGERISVAEVAVDAILNLPQFSTSGEPTTESAPAIELPKVSVAAVTPIVDEGTSVQFNISSHGNLNDNVVVGYTLTPEGDFFGNLGQGTQWVNLSAKRSNTLVEIATIDDTSAERDGSLSLTLIDSRTYDLTDQSSARVAISDSTDRQQRVEDITSAVQDIQVEMTGALGALTLGFTSNRISSAFASKGVASTFMYNGKQDLTELIEVSGEAINGNSMTLREVLGNSSFAISLFPETNGPSIATIWGLGDNRVLTSAEGSNSRYWDGDIFSGHLGLDAMVGQRLLVGILAAVTESDFDHIGTTEDTLTFISRTTALNPYLGWTSADQAAELRAVAGYGVGAIDIDQTNYELQTVSNSYHTLGIIGNQRIYASDSILEDGVSELSISGQSWYTRQNLFGIEDLINSLQTDASHYRIGIEGSHTQSLASGSTLKPTISVGLRGDGKDWRSIFGIEVSSGISYTSTLGLSITGNSNMFLNEQGEIQKWSLLGTVSYDQGSDKLGTFMEISPSYGQMHRANSRSLWSSDILENVSETGQYLDGVHVDTEIGFGLSILGDTSRLTPFGGISYSNESKNKYHVGTRLQFDSELTFELTGMQETDTEGTQNRKIKLDGAFNW